MSLTAELAVRLGTLALDVRLNLVEGQILAVVGPNGAGKSTLIRSLAGLVPLSSGRVILDGQVLDDPDAGIHVPTERRSLGVMFQNYLLFPHLSALDNVAFGLRSRGLGRRQARAEAGRWIELMHLSDLASEKPASLSGGQQQRLALARALAGNPRLLLLDEPTSALDATYRAQVRRDLVTHLRSCPGLTLVVTHDPIEAVSLADRLLVLEDGRVIQEGSGAEVAHRPRSDYVADLVGVNLFRGNAAGGAIQIDGGGTLLAARVPEGPVFAVIHPRAVSLHRHRPEGTPRNVWPGVPAGIEPFGDRVRVRIDGVPRIVAEITPEAVRSLDLDLGGEVWVSVKATGVATYPR